MKITFILAANSLTGGYRAIYELSNRLIKRGHKVNLVYPLVPLNIKPGFKMMNPIRMIRSILGNLIKRRKVKWFNIKADLIRVLTLSPKFIRLFEKQIPDSDIVVATAWETAYVVNKLSAKKGAKTYFVQHYEIWDMWNDDDCWQEAEKNEHTKNGLHMAMADITPKDPILYGLKKLVDDTYRMPLVKITTAHWLSELLEKKFDQKAERITLGVNPDDFHQEITWRDARKNVLVPVRSAKWKGFDNVVQALRIVQERIRGLDIIVYGENHIGQIPQFMKARNLKMVFGSELRKLYSSADIFVFPSRVEGWGLPPMEAMACGTACVTTEVGGVLDYTVPGKTAIVVPPNSPEKLAEAIICLLQDDDRRLAVASAGQEYIKQFSWEKTAGQFEAIFKKTMDTGIMENVRSSKKTIHTIEDVENANAS